MDTLASKQIPVTRLITNWRYAESMDQRPGTSIAHECEGQTVARGGIPISYTIDFIAAREPRPEILKPSCRRNHSILCLSSSDRALVGSRRLLEHFPVPIEAADIYIYIYKVFRRSRVSSVCQVSREDHSGTC
ncbi:uncharacterized protein LOC123327089 [Drosophila simulans]|uniref:uncharacterized protein LOC123327089 n=1 Tax=Drosophila simulans TaxID=7240 RepID=UPI001D103197|nr:uncharacterized protein LOC123327089 [Drosophila simulans]